MPLFDTSDPTSILKHVRGAEKYRRDNVTDRSRPLKKSYFTGRTTSDGYGEHPENIVYSFVSQSVAQVAYSRPRFRAKSKRLGRLYKGAAAGVQHATNRNAEDVTLEEQIRLSITDMMFDYAVGRIDTEDHPTLTRRDLEEDSDEPLRRPTFARVNPEDYGHDPLAKRPDDILFAFERWEIDQDGLQKIADEADEDERWSPSVVPTLSGSTDVGTQKERSAAEDRELIQLYDIWFRDEQIDGFEPGDGYHGSLWTLAVLDDGNDGEKGVWVREGMPWFGPDFGPWVYTHVLDVPNEPYGTTPLLSTRGQIEELNKMARAVNDAAARFKRVIFVAGEEEGFGELVSKAYHQEVVELAGAAEDARKSIVDVEIGGTSTESISQLERLRSQVELTLGISDAQRGAANGDATATEAAIADQSSGIITDWLQRRAYDFVAKIGDAWAWYFVEDPEVAVQVNEEAFREIYPDAEIASDGERGEGFAFVGGRDEEDEAKGGFSLSIHDLSLEVEPLSMSRTTEGIQQKRALEGLQLFIQIMQAAMVMPFAPWDEIAGTVGDQLNMPGLQDMVEKGLQRMQQALGGGQGLPGIAPQGSPAAAAPPGGTGLPGNQTGGQLAGAARG